MNQFMNQLFYTYHIHYETNNYFLIYVYHLYIHIKNIILYIYTYYIDNYDEYK